MRRFPTASPHTFHIPVMGTGFTIDTPLKVARFGIDSVVSLVDDVLIEQVRRRTALAHGVPCDPIADGDDDARARRITAYLDLLDDLVRRQVARVRTATFRAGSEISRYFELLPPSPARRLYEKMRAAADNAVRRRLQERLRELVVPGSIDVNIMTKLDRDRDRRGRPLPERCSDALSALRGFARSRVESAVVLSAGMNRRLFAYMATFDAFFPDAAGRLRKRIVLKVSDYRSALVQGKLLARLGLTVSEFRVESGLNCGGHAFGGKGQLLGPVLEEFRRHRDELAATLADIRRRAWEAAGRAGSCGEPPPPRLTVQGGIGTAAEDRFLREHYGVDGTGWGSPFLLVPEVVNIDPDSLRRVAEAGEEDIVLSGASPLGVPFWSLRTSASERRRRERVAAGRPGSACPKGFLVSTSEFTEAPLCTASRAYQRRKLATLAAGAAGGTPSREAVAAVTAKACICHDLAGGYTGPAGLDTDATTAVCCGPNTAYFKQVVSLDAMVDHIYGRCALPLAPERPPMLLKELSLHLAGLRREAARLAAAAGSTVTAAADAAADTAAARALAACRDNLLAGIRHYRELAGRLAAPRREAFLRRLEELRRELETAAPATVAASG